MRKKETIIKRKSRIERIWTASIVNNERKRRRGKEKVSNDEK